MKVKVKCKPQKKRKKRKKADRIADELVVVTSALWAIHTELRYLRCGGNKHVGGHLAGLNEALANIDQSLRAIAPNEPCKG